ncbi:MAG TPA: retropepsin-like aspartic protease [bacterium]|nr:retropepsin-like aspartic protease [bacterium]
MRFPASIPLVARNVKIVGPKGFLKIDMIVDTGAVFTAVSWSDLKAIGYDPATVPDRQEIITANGVIEVPKLCVARIALGDVEASEVEVICHDIPELAGIRGLLGLSFLRHFRNVIDYREGYFEFS